MAMDKTRTTSDSLELDKIKELAKIIDEQASIILEKKGRFKKPTSVQNKRIINSEICLSPCRRAFFCTK